MRDWVIHFERFMVGKAIAEEDRHEEGYGMDDFSIVMVVFVFFLSSR